MDLLLVLGLGTGFGQPNLEQQLWIGLEDGGELVYDLSIAPSK